MKYVAASNLDELPLGFDEARQANSGFAQHDWPRYRRGLRRLLHRFARGKARARVRLAVAEDVVDCATHWGMGGGIVGPALKSLLRLDPPARALAYAAGQYAFWARRTPANSHQHAALKLLQLAERRLSECPELTRRNLAIMLAKAHEGLVDVDSKT